MPNSANSVNITTTYSKVSGKSTINQTNKTHSIANILPLDIYKLYRLKLNIWLYKNLKTNSQFSSILMADLITTRSASSLYSRYRLSSAMATQGLFQRISEPTNTVTTPSTLRNNISSNIVYHSLGFAWSVNINTLTTLTSLDRGNFVHFDGHVPIIFFNDITSKFYVRNNLSFFSLDLSNKNLSLSKSNHIDLFKKLSEKRKAIAFKLYSQEKYLKKITNRTRKARSKTRALDAFLPALFRKKYDAKKTTKPTRQLRRRAGKNYQPFSRPQNYIKVSNGTNKSLFTIRLNLNRLTSYLSNINNIPNTGRIQEYSPINHKNRSTTELTTNNLQYTSYFNNISLHSINTSYSFSCRKANILPNKHILRSNLLNFKPKLTRELPFDPDIVPWVNDSLIRFIEHCSGKRALLQHNMNVNFAVNNSNKLMYRKWIQRMSSYERNLGHRFFMEEALHIIHLSFRLHDAKLFTSWLKAMITRISFWRTRSIFRFFKYIFNNYYRFMFDSLSIKGIKIRLKGKISAAGNSRKRTIIFRSGKSSYSSVNTKCLHEFKTVTTFTGVMGLQVWLFY